MKAAFVPEENEPPEDGGRWPRKPLGPRLLRQHRREDPSRAPKARPGLAPASCHGSCPGEEGRSP